MITRLPWRQLCAGAMAVLCLLLCVFAGSASAELRLRTSVSEPSVSIDSEVNWFSGTPGASSVETRFQFYAYWDADGVLAIAMKESGRITRQRLTEEVIPNRSDYRNTLGFAISPNDGRFHISYREEGGAHRYLISEPCLPARCRFTAARYQVDRPSEALMEEPAYITAPDGTLFFTWRYGISSSNGDQYLNRYNDDGRWTHLGAILQGTDGTRYTFDPDEGGPARSITTSARAPVLRDMVFGASQGLHVVWSWREYTSATEANQHGIFYVDSFDGGRTWVDNLGRRIATTRTDPITFADTSTLVIGDPPGYFIDNLSLAVDSHDNPHIIMSESGVQTNDRVMTDMRRTHVWRTTDAAWHADYLEETGNSSTHLTGGELFFDQADTAYFIYARTETLNWEPWNADPYAQNDLPLRNLLWRNRELLNVRLYSAETALRTNGYVGIPINSERRELRIRMRNNTRARDVQIHWTTDEDPTWTAGKGQYFSNVLSTEDSEYRDYTLTITDPDWNGTLRNLEIYPAEGVSSGTVVIDWIKIRRGSAVDLATWEFNEGNVLMAAEAGPARNWGTWNIGPLLPEISDEFGDRDWGIDRAVFDRTNSYVQLPILEAGLAGTALTMKTFLTSFDNYKDWPFEVDAIGWSASRQVTGFGWANDAGTKGIAGTLAGREGQIRSTNYLHLAETSRYIHIRMRRTHNSELRFLRVDFETEEGSGGSESVRLRPEEAEYATYTVNMEERLWNERIVKEVWLTFEGGSGTRGNFYIDRIWVDWTP